MLATGVIHLRKIAAITYARARQLPGTSANIRWPRRLGEKPRERRSLAAKKVGRPRKITL